MSLGGTARAGSCVDRAAKVAVGVLAGAVASGTDRPAGWSDVGVALTNAGVGAGDSGAGVTSGTTGVHTVGGASSSVRWIAGTWSGAVRIGSSVAAGPTHGEGDD
ncbi:MAG: hypothetical protein ACREX7_10390, partial [Casimicrobiaceae bacterium]